MAMSKVSGARIESAARLDEARGLDLFIQYADGSCYPVALAPEMRLMAMILEDAVICFQRFAGAQSNPGLSEFRDAERWLFGGEKDWIFSFENICACLGLDPLYIRSGLRLWQRMNQHPDLDASARRRGCWRGRIRPSRASPKIRLLR